MAQAGKPARRNGLRAATIAVLSLLLVAGVGRAVGADGHELGPALGLLAHPWPVWIVVAVLLEVASFLSYAVAQRGLVRAAGHRLSIGWLASLAVSAQALNNFLPAGYLAANALNFKQLRHHALSAGEALWLLVMTSVLYIGSLGTLALIGTGVVGGQAGGATRYLSLGACVLAASLLVVLSLGARRHAAAGAHMDTPGEPSSWPATLRGRCLTAVRTLMRSLAQVRLSRRGTGTALLLFAACWLLDAGCLIASFRAVGAQLPWHTLLVAYCGAQLVSFLPVTPGGLGLVEGSLTVALAAGGLGAVHVLSGVLLYRAISYWGTLPTGLLGYYVIRRARRGTNAGARVASPEWPVPTVSAAPSNT